jgi:hypothetical protein
MRKVCVVGVAVVSLAALLAGATRGQIGRLPIQPSQSSYTVRLVNEMGYPIRVKMVRFGSGRYLEEDLSRNGSVTRELYAGERVLCVWSRDQTLRLAAQVDVDTSGTLRLRPIAYPAAGAAPRAVPQGAPRQSMEPLPRLKLEP